MDKLGLLARGLLELGILHVTVAPDIIVLEPDI
jgi:hypothetical protein